MESILDLATPIADSFLEPRGKNANGWGTGTLMPMLPTSASFMKRRAMPPSRVNMQAE